jgi:hypothetical protein
MLARGELTPDQKFCQEGMHSWIPLSQMEPISEVPPPPPLNPPRVLPGSQASKGPAPQDPSASSFRRVSSIRLAKSVPGVRGAPPKTPNTPNSP